MIVTRKALPRRTVLRGIGAAIALPLLDGMVPAFAAIRNSAARPRPRLSVLYFGNGAVMQDWTPAATGTDFAFSPSLAPLAPLRDRVLVLSGLDNQPGERRPGEPAGGHGRISGSYLTGVHVKPTEGADFEAGVSIDQIAASHLGRETQLASLELSLEATAFAGACDAGFSCAYITTLSWRTPTTPLPMENNPRAVFERLFGDSQSTDPAARLERIRTDRSILDSVAEKAASLKARLGARDRAKMTEYLDSVRDVERRIRMAEAQSDRELPVVEQPSGVPAAFDDYAGLMFDLQVVAFQADLTRIATCIVAPEISSRAYPQIGVADPHHALSHHQNKPENLSQLTKINTYHTQLVAGFLEKLRRTPDGDGTLLDQVAAVYGRGMADSNAHTALGLPLVVAGGAAGQLRGGRHIRYEAGTPFTNLYVSLLGKMGVPVERIGDSTGALTELSDI